MDFITSLPRTIFNRNAIWVIVYKLSKTVHFLPFRTTDSTSRLVHLYIYEIIGLHGVSSSIVSDRDPRFTSYFWDNFQEALSFGLYFSTIQMLEDVLCTCIIDFDDNWYEHLFLYQFAYNNSNHSSIVITPYEPLYGRPYHPPTYWNEVGNQHRLRLDFIQEIIEKVAIIRRNLATTQSCQKGYTDNRRRPLEFAVGDQVFLKIFPYKEKMWFDKKGKLSPHYVGPFQIVEHVGTVAYCLALP